MRGSLQGAKILSQIFCIYFAFHAILSIFRKICKKKFRKKFLKKFVKKFFCKFFEKCLELHETQSKLKKIEVNFFPLKGPLPGLNQIFGICPLIQTWAISRFSEGFRMGWRPPGPPAGVRSLGTRVRAPRRG